MIVAYHRPATLEEALALLARTSPATLPLGGGTRLSRAAVENVEVVDLQRLGLSAIGARGGQLEIGATVTLEQVRRSPEVPAALRIAAALEAPLNLRNAATVAGTLIVAEGTSTLTGALLAADATLAVAISRSPALGTDLHDRGTGQEGETGAQRGPTLSLGAFLATREQIRGSLITGLTMRQTPQMAFEYVARTPKARPIIFIAVAVWPSGRVRAAVGGWGSAPRLAVDGVGPGGLVPAVQNAVHDASDAFGSAEYRVAAVAVLASRCAARLGLGPTDSEARQ